MGPVEDYVRGWIERGERLLAAREERARSARELVPRLVEHLVAHYRPSRVWLIGSLLEGGFHERWDIDLVVEGITPDSRRSSAMWPPT